MLGLLDNDDKVDDDDIDAAGFLNWRGRRITPFPDVFFVGTASCSCCFSAVFRNDRFDPNEDMVFPSVLTAGTAISLAGCVCSVVDSGILLAPLRAVEKLNWLLVLTGDEDNSRGVLMPSVLGESGGSANPIVAL